MPSSAIIVPSCPSGVVFQKDDFLGTTFDIDAFLASYAGTSGLESLRDDLGMYLQVLRVAMIELINDDYADFVNLSSNLVGIEDKIHAIESPLRTFKDQILAFVRKLNSTQGALEAKLGQRKELHDQRVALRNLEHIINLLNKIERLIGLHDQEHDKAAVVELKGDLVERLASDVNYLNHCVNKCGATAFVKEIEPRMDIIWSHLQRAMEGQFLKAVEENDAEAINRYLRIYASIDRVADAENLIRANVIAPYLTEVISSKKLHSDPLGLEGVCQNILKLVPEKLELLLQINRAQSKKKAGSFNFLLKSLWPEMVEKFEQQLPIIFSAGNPDQFHTNYITMVNFIKKLETWNVSSQGSSASSSGGRQELEMLDSKVCQNFIHRWNLSVYFQIRFQEIAGPVEEACQELFALEIASSPADASAPAASAAREKFYLKATRIVMEAVANCWKSQVFLWPLAQKFWKLTLQIVARYGKAVALALKEDYLKSLLTETNSSSISSETLGGEEKPTMVTKLTPSPSVPSSLHAKTKSHFRSASDTSQIAEDEKVVFQSEEELTRRLIMLYLDVGCLADEKLDEILQNHVWPAMSQGSALSSSSLELTECAKSDYFEQSLQESGCELRHKLDCLSGVITDRIVGKSIIFLKQVADIPRLYRRTNRELPSKPTAYMTSMLEPITQFHALLVQMQTIEEASHSWLVTIFNKVAVKFLSELSQVLDAVQKMEESLLRLRRVRDKSSTPQPTSTSQQSMEKDSKSVSDDDKIRLQLYVDVQAFIKTMTQLGVEPSQVEKAVELDKLVTDVAMKSCLLPPASNE